jgi:phenylpyruvate tautomerase PptA (4-oxalocrotonate tautomerase family)
MTFEVEDLEATLAELRARGVNFERFEMPGFDARGDTIAAPDHYPSKGTGELGTFFHDSEGNLIGIAPAGARRSPVMSYVALARIDILEGRSREEKREIVDAVRGALSEALQAPRDDPTVRLAEHPGEHFSLPYPDRHSDRFTLVEATMFAGRSTDAKRRLYRAIAGRRSAAGVRSADVLIVLNESPTENWAIDGATPASEADVGFEIDI